MFKNVNFIVQRNFIKFRITSQLIFFSIASITCDIPSISLRYNFDSFMATIIRVKHPRWIRNQTRFHASH